MFDIFYKGKSPELGLNEKQAESIECAQSRAGTRYFWWVHYLAELDQWDWLWEPPPWQAGQRHAWASQHQKDAGIYLVPKAGYSDTNYHDQTIKRLPDQLPWQIPDYVDPTSVDLSWHPDPAEPPYIWHFAAPWNWGNIGGVTYRSVGADTIKHSDQVGYRTRCNDALWTVPDWIDPDSIDRSWVPNPSEPPYIYEFPVEWGWNRTGGPQYRVPGATQIKYVSDFCVRTLPGTDLEILDNVHPDDPVCRWRPNPADPPMTYVFGNQWWPAEKRYSAVYRVPGSLETKYLTSPRAQRQSDPSLFRVLIDCEFDFSWEPDPGDPPYIYVFGNQWWPAEKMPTVEYHAPGASEIKFMSAPRAQLKDNPHDHWHALESCVWDRTWRPDPGDPPYIYVFGNQWWPAEIWPTLEYHVPGATERKYVSNLRAQLLPDHTSWSVPDGIDLESVDFSWRPDPGSPPYCYEFGTQWQKTGGAVYTVPGACDTKYVSAFRCRKVSHDPQWRLPLDLPAVMADFDWTWHPDATEQPYIYEFGSQHQKTGGPQYHVPGASETKYVEQIRVEIQNSRAAVIVLDHLDGHARDLAQSLVQKLPVIKTVRYVNNYLDTLRRIAATVDAEWIWIASSICDYSNFDWTWYPEQWQNTMLHVFASDQQKFGDTFFMHVSTFRERSAKCKLLEWYDVNFLDVSVPRRSLPKVVHQEDSHVEIIKQANLAAPLTLFVTGLDQNCVTPAVNLWRDEVKAVTPLDAGGCAVIVPREITGRITQQLYDYPIIDKSHRHGRAEPLDIVFISNGETNAEQNWEVLNKALHAIKAPNRLTRVDGINGRAAAYRAALSSSHTPWAFCVFAKLRINENFDWAWQPDRMQQPKHYIFHARNPVNRLEYGHQAMIAYNKKLVMTNPAQGLDFTLDQPHEVVPVLSGTAEYHTDAWTCWRTAFREVLKLRYSLPDVENEYRLNQWLQENNDGDLTKWSHIGAQDAMRYYDDVCGDFAAIKLTYEWSWLADYVAQIHPELVTQSRT